MRLFKKFLKNYLFFGLGIVFGSAIGTITTYAIMSATYGTPDSLKILQIRECLEEKINE